jgi:hypothetical protein
MAKPFEPKYTNEQREAVDFAYMDRAIRPARRIVELAAAGELVGRNGVKLEAFEIDQRTVRSIASKAQKKRLGIGKTRLTEMPERDAKAELKRRLIAIADHGTQTILDRQAKGEETPWQQVSLMTRAVREINALPEPKDAASAAKPGAFVNGKQAEGPSRGGMVGQLLREHRGEARNAEDATRVAP